MKQLIFFVLLLASQGFCETCESLEKGLYATSNMKEVKNAIQALLSSECENAFSAVAEFSLKGNTFGTEPFNNLIEYDMERFANWVLKNYSDFTQSNWVGLSWVGITGELLGSNDYYNFIVNQSNSNEDEKIRAEIRRGLYRYIKYSEVVQSQAFLKSEIRSASRARLFGMNAKFKSATTDSLLR
ncbi:MAG: hypothetical protein GF344_03730 [Chitinivibrionales bacterium]|nr:hypothetical protein [Chitinivibrionales bacterium]